MTRMEQLALGEHVASVFVAWTLGVLALGAALTIDVGRAVVYQQRMELGCGAAIVACGWLTRTNDAGAWQRAAEAYADQVYGSGQDAPAPRYVCPVYAGEYPSDTEVGAQFRVGGDLLTVRCSSEGAGAACRDGSPARTVRVEAVRSCWLPLARLIGAGQPTVVASASAPLGQPVPGGPGSFGGYGRLAGVSAAPQPTRWLLDGLWPVSQRQQAMVVAGRVIQ